MEKILEFNKKTKHHAIMKKKISPKKTLEDIQPPKPDMRERDEVESVG